MNSNPTDGPADIGTADLFDVEITSPLPELPAEEVRDALAAGLETVHADAELSIDSTTEQISVTQTIRSRERASPRSGRVQLLRRGVRWGRETGRMGRAY